MFDKISASQFRLIYKELTGDNSCNENKKSKEYDERVKLILKHGDPTLSRDLRKNNAAKSKYDQFWDIAQKTIDEMTAVNDRRHACGSSTSGEVAVNMALAISASDLFSKCKQAALDCNLTENDIPSFSF